MTCRRYHPLVLVWSIAACAPLAKVEAPAGSPDAHAPAAGSGPAGGAPGGNPGGAPGGSAGGAPGGSAGGAPGGSAGGAPGGGTGGSPGGDAGAAVDAPVSPAMPGGPVPLPLVVTDQFPNRGWFGDGAVALFFKTGSTLIREVAGSAGLCGARPSGARGQCLQVTYTPPPGLAPAAGAGAFVGSYMLTSLAQPHLDVSPPARPGDPNWGLEPGLAVTPGARQISFYAASDQPNVRVAFRAGTNQDLIYLPERTEVLTAGWTKYTIPLAGGAIGPALLGGFAWTIKDTTRPATFYLDGIVWEAEGPLPPVPAMGTRDGVRQVVFINRCAQPIHVGATSQMALPEGGGFLLDAGQSHTVVLPGGLWSGRFWGRTGCHFDAAGVGSCETGDCGGRLRCAGGGNTPATLAELTLSAGPPNADFYDISLVDGYNLPMAIAPLGGTHERNPGAPYDCLIPSCVADLNATCPADLRVAAGAGTVGCLSACEKFQSDQFCCRGAFATPETCPPFDAARVFKTACPTAYSYAYDDSTSTFTCKGEDYAIWFCPQAGQP